MSESLPLPRIVPLGDAALLVRFADRLSDEANRAAIAFSRVLGEAGITGVEEIDPNLVSVLVRIAKGAEPERIAGEIRLLLSAERPASAVIGRTHRIAVRFGGEEGPDLEAVAAALGLAPEAFVAAHNATPLRVLTTGFAPGFVYCGFHDEALNLPRRSGLRENVMAGSLLFAAGQTALAATTIRTGWHVIGRTDFRNFDAGTEPPTVLREGDRVVFSA